MSETLDPRAALQKKQRTPEEEAALRLKIDNEYRAEVGMPLVEAPDPTSLAVPENQRFIPSIKPADLASALDMSKKLHMPVQLALGLVQSQPQDADTLLRATNEDFRRAIRELPGVSAWLDEAGNRVFSKEEFPLLMKAATMAGDAKQYDGFVKAVGENFWQFGSKAWNGYRTMYGGGVAGAWALDKIDEEQAIDEITRVGQELAISRAMEAPDLRKYREEGAVLENVATAAGDEATAGAFGAAKAAGGLARAIGGIAQTEITAGVGELLGQDGQEIRRRMGTGARPELDFNEQLLAVGFDKLMRAAGLTDVPPPSGPGADALQGLKDMEAGMKQAQGTMGKLGVAAGAMGDQAAHAAANPLDFVITNAEQLANQIPTRLAQAALYASPLGAAGIPYGQAASAPTEFMMEAFEALTDGAGNFAPIDITDRDAVRDGLRRPGFKEEVLRRAIAKGIATPILGWAIDAMGIKAVAKTLEKGGSKLLGKAVAAGAGMVEETVSEGGSKYASTAAAKEDFSEGSFQLGGSFSEGLIGSGFGGAPIWLGGQAVAKTGLNDYMQAKFDERTAKIRAKRAKELHELARSLGIATTVPERLRDLLNSAYATGVVKVVSIPKLAWDEFWIKKGFDPASVTKQQFGDRVDYQAASETGLLEMDYGDAMVTLDSLLPGTFDVMLPWMRFEGATNVEEAILQLELIQARQEAESVAQAKANEEVSKLTAEDELLDKEQDELGVPPDQRRRMEQPAPGEEPAPEQEPAAAAAPAAQPMVAEDQRVAVAKAVQAAVDASASGASAEAILPVALAAAGVDPATINMDALVEALRRDPAGTAAQLKSEAAALRNREIVAKRAEIARRAAELAVGTLTDKDVYNALLKTRRASMVATGANPEHAHAAALLFATAIRERAKREGTTLVEAIRRGNLRTATGALGPQREAAGERMEQGGRSPAPKKYFFLNGKLVGIPYNYIHDDYVITHLEEFGLTKEEVAGLEPSEIWGAALEKSGAMRVAVEQDNLNLTALEINDEAVAQAQEIATEVMAKGQKPLRVFLEDADGVNTISTDIETLLSAKSAANLIALAKRRLYQGGGRKPTSDLGHKRDSSGRYVGAPDWIGKSPQKLVFLRRKLRALALEGEAGRFWYERSSQAILAMAGGDKLEAERIAGLIAIYSPTAQVPGNTTMALTAYYQWKAGLPIDAGYGSGDAKAQAWMDHGTAWSGIKTRSFFQNLMVEIDPTRVQDAATMDMWMAIAFDYGSDALDQGPKYKFGEREIQAIARDLGWTPHQVQAAIWTAMKARTTRIKKELLAKDVAAGNVVLQDYIDKAGEPKQRKKIVKPYEHFRLAHKLAMRGPADTAAIGAAKYDFGDALEERSAQMSVQAGPGDSTGLLPGLRNATPEQRMEYLAELAKVMRDGDKDIVAGLAGLAQGTAMHGVVAWEGDVNTVEQRFFPVPSEDKEKETEEKKPRTVREPAKAALNRYAALLGYILRLDRIAWHQPIYKANLEDQNALELRPARSLNEAEIRLLNEAVVSKLGPFRIAVGDSLGGVRVVNSRAELDAKAFQAGMQEIIEALPEDFGGGQVDLLPYRSDGNDLSNDWRLNPDGEEFHADAFAGRPDLQERARDLRARVDAVRADFVARYGWDQPGEPAPERAAPAVGPAEVAAVQLAEQQRKIAEADARANYGATTAVEPRQPGDTEGTLADIARGLEPDLAPVEGDRFVNILPGLEFGDPAAVKIDKTIKVRGPHDAAALLAAFRSPYLEKMVAAAIAPDGTIRNVVLISIGTIDSAIVYAMLDEATRSIPSEKAAALFAALGLQPGDTFVFSHNHPSGNPRASADDLALYASALKAANAAGAKFMGLVLDHDSFTSVDNSFNIETRPGKVGPRFKAHADTVKLGGAYTDPGAVAALASKMRLDNATAALIHIDTRGGLAGISVLTANELKDVKAMRARIEREQAQVGARGTVIVVNNTETMWSAKAFKVARGQSMIYDVVALRGDSPRTFESAVLSGALHTSGGRNSRVGWHVGKVMEDIVGYSNPEEQPPFYSHALRSVEALMIRRPATKMGAEQWLRTLLQGMGVKKEELVWLDLEYWLKDMEAGKVIQSDDWLVGSDEMKLRPAGPITVQELRDFIERKQLVLVEFNFGATEDDAEQPLTITVQSFDDAVRTPEFQAAVDAHIEDKVRAELAERGDEYTVVASEGDPENPFDVEALTEAQMQQFGRSLDRGPLWVATGPNGIPLDPAGNEVGDAWGVFGADGKFVSSYSREGPFEGESQDQGLAAAQQQVAGHQGWTLRPTTIADAQTFETSDAAWYAKERHFKDWAPANQTQVWDVEDQDGNVFETYLTWAEATEGAEIANETHREGAEENIREEIDRDAAAREVYDGGGWQGTTLPRGPRAPRYSNPRYNLGGGTDYGEKVMVLPRPMRKGQAFWVDPQHYTDIPGALGWFRHDTRIGPDGEKVLFLQELQTGIHAEALRKRQAEIERVMAANPKLTEGEASKLVPWEYGYQMGAVSLDEIDKTSTASALAFQAHQSARGHAEAMWRRVQRAISPDYAEVLSRAQQVLSYRAKWRVDEGGTDLFSDEDVASAFDEVLRATPNPFPDAAGRATFIAAGRDYMQASFASWRAQDTSDAALAAYDKAAGTGGVPDTPMKEEIYTRLVERAVRYAADHGFARVAWTTGGQQQERWGLGSLADLILYDQASGRLTSYSGGVLTASYTGITPEVLPRYVGADITKELLRGEPVPVSSMPASPEDRGRPVGTSMHGPGARVTVAQGEGLIVGKKWPLDIYDNKITGAFAKIARNNGGGKVETVNLGGGGQGPAMGTKEHRRIIGEQPSIAITPAVSQGAKAGKRMFQAAPEPLPSHIDVNGVQRPTTNSLGKPIAQTRQGVENFWIWFGDASTVDHELKPIAGVHYTKAEFDQFSHEEAARKKFDEEGYTTNYGLSFVFPKKGFFFFLGDAPRPAFGSAHAVPAYIALKNPLDLRQPIPAGTTSAIIDFLQREFEKPAVPGEAGFRVRGIPGVITLRDARAHGITPAQLWALVNHNSYRDRGQTWDSLLDAIGADGLIFPANSSGTFLHEQARGPGDGKEYVVAVARHPEQVKSSIGNSGGFDPKSPLLNLQTGKQKGDTPRGYLDIGPKTRQGGRDFDLRLFASADWSTIVHELGHFWLEILGDMAEAEGASDQVKADWQGLLRYLEVTDRSQIGDEEHEYWAKSAEAYFAEGKAPSPELEGIFAAFRGYMVAIYRDVVKALGVELTDEVRGIMDRMLASEDATMAAQYEVGDEMRPEVLAQFDKATQNQLQAAAREAGDEAIAKLSAQQHSIFNETRKAALNRRIEAIRPKVAEQVERLPGSVALSKILQSDGPRLSRAEVKKHLKGQGKTQKLRDLEKTGALADDGLPLSTVAELLGFESEATLLGALLVVSNKEALIDKTARDTVLAETPELNTPKAIDKQAKDAVVSSKRSQQLYAQLQATERLARLMVDIAGEEQDLRKKAEAKVERRDERQRQLRSAIETLEPFEIIRDAVTATLNALEFQDLKPYRFLADAKRESGLFTRAMLARNPVEAAAHKRRELIAHEKARQSRLMIAEAERTRQYAKRMLTPKAQGTMGHAGSTYLDQMNGLLNDVALHKMSKPEMARRQKFADWSDKQRAAGFQVNVPQELVDEAKRKPFQRMTMPEIKALDEAMRNLFYVASTKDRLRLAGVERSFNKLSSDIANQIGKDKPLFRELHTPLERALLGGLEVFAEITKRSSYVYQMDGYKYGGVVASGFEVPLNNAGAAEAGMQAHAAKEFQKLTSMYGDFKRVGWYWKKTLVPGTTLELTQEQRLAVLLNMGNDGNLQRLRNTYTDAQLHAIIATFDERDALFAQGVWDFLATYWPKIEAKEKRVYGVAPERVQFGLNEFTTRLNALPGVAMRGGYYPIVYTGQLAAMMTVADQAKAMMAGAASSSQTWRGFTKLRSESNDNKLWLDSMAPMFRHVNAVIHDLTHHESLIAVNRLMRHKGVRGAMEAHYGEHVVKQFSSSIEDIAAGVQAAHGRYEMVVGHIRTGQTLNALAWNAMSAAVQFTGLATSADRVGWHRVFIAQAKLFRSLVDQEKIIATIRRNSPTMDARGRTWMREANEVLNDLRKPRHVAQLEATMMWAVGKAQFYVDCVTWLAAYEKAIADTPGLDESAAWQYADQLVLSSQGGGQVKDLAHIQRGGPMMKLWTSFITYPITRYNLTREAGGKFWASDRGVTDGLKLALSLLNTWVIPAVIEEFIRARLKGEPWEPEEETKNAGWKILLGIFEPFPLVRDAAAIIASGVYDFDGPAGTRWIQSGAKLWGDIVKDKDAHAAMMGAEVLGAMFHLPLTPVVRTARGIHAMTDEGADIRAPIFGPPSKR